MSIDRQYQQFDKKATESVTAPEPKKVCNVCEGLQKRVMAQEADIKALKGALANAEVALTQSNSLSNTQSNKLIDESNKSNTDSNAFDKAEYQRQYMRDRRAAKKAEKP